MLRVSGQAKGETTDVSAVREGTDTAAASGVAHAVLLVAFAEALVAHDEARLAALRPQLIDAIGPDGFLETATVAANFQRMNRIADATGIPQETPVLALASDLIEDLGLGAFGSAKNTPPPGVGTKLLGRIVRPFVAKLMNSMRQRGG